MKKKWKDIMCLVLVVAVFVTGSLNVYAKPYSGKNSYYGNWTEKSGFLWMNTDSYRYEATYSNSFITLLDNLSGTKYWDNYKNKKKTAQELKIGISKTKTVSKTYAWSVSGDIGFKVPVKAVEVSGSMGGSYTSSKTYEKTVGTSSEYTINTESKNGYYAVSHAVNCDAYNVKIFKNGSSYESGKIIRYAGNGYERLWYSDKPF